MNKLVTFFAAALVGAAVVAEPTITDVTAQQRYPWNGKVDIRYTASGIDAAANAGGWTPALKVTARDVVGGTTYVATNVVGELATADGTHALVWDLNADGIVLKSTNVVFSVTCSKNSANPPVQPSTGLYCVIDLSGGPTATSYPVSYLADVPAGGWSDEYKTTKLVLRRIEPGTFTMGDQVHGGSVYPNITLTQPFWLGVFEVTQKQYQLVTDSTPSSYSGDMRPVECVSWDTIKSSTGFIAKLTARTGLVCDLPTEAQWEYACRAGTTTDYNNGTNYSNSGEDANMDVVGCYWYNCQANKGGYTYGHKNVGSYVPNAWGLYDMHGNVWEWCRDWYGSLSAGATDPTGGTSGSYRVLRGGCWNDLAYGCASSYRNYGNPSGEINGSGFRLSCSLGSSGNK